MELSVFLAEVVGQQASDLFLSAGAPPLMKVDGVIRPMREERLSAEDNEALVYSILNDREIRDYEGTWELNKSLWLPKVGRFRVNVFRQRGQPALVARYIKESIPSIEALGLPTELKALIMEERGLVLIVGGTGTGKSTTLASMIDYRNATRPGHILTIEDPIEFVYENKQALVNQREVGLDTVSFEEALKNAMREAPDVILIGEIRDRDTMRHAIAYAETGHLCLATLHANSAAQALERILNFFPADSHAQLLQDLALNLRAVVAQRLCVGRSGARVAAVELMALTPYIADLIDKGRIDEIPEAMRRSKGRTCTTMDQALYTLFTAGTISEDEALRNADSRNDLALQFRLEAATGPKVYPIKSEYAIDQKAPFDHYETFDVTAVKVDGRNPDAAGLLNAAIVRALVQKGLELNVEAPDVNVQYVFGIKSMKGVELDPISGEGKARDYYVPETKEHAMLVISVVDSKAKKPVYRLTASRRMSETEATQDEVNGDLEKLLETLPVGRSLNAFGAQ